MNPEIIIYLDTPVAELLEKGLIDRTIARSCQSAKPPMLTAGDIVAHLEKNGNFASVPGCRRPGRIPDALSTIAEATLRENTPRDLKPQIKKRRIADDINLHAGFDFLTDEQREEILTYRHQHGHLPMFVILRHYLNRPGASRNDTIMAFSLGLSPDKSRKETLSTIAGIVNLSRERVRQIAQSYILPEQLSHPKFWTHYADHSTYFADKSHPSFLHTVQYEIPDLSFAAYAAVLHRTTMLQNVDDRYLARRGWVNEISAWLARLSRLAAMPRTIDSRISIEGLAMGGSLDTRINLVVLNQIAPTLGIIPDAPDGIILPKNKP